MSKQNVLLSELTNQLKAVHYLGESRLYFHQYLELSEKVMLYIQTHKDDIIDYIDTWINHNWQSSEDIYCEFYTQVNEGQELDALRTLNIKG